GFAAFGHTSGSVVAGVVLYRLISNWGLVPIGWAAIAAHHRVHPEVAYDGSDGVGLEPLRQPRVGVGAREQDQPERRAPDDPRPEGPDAPDGSDDREGELRGLRHVSGARC
ncbi:MAG: hypothetical protein QOE10_1909, partial [Gaiellales bacterium]|nr:hypothetical protein [Gaiellales bacterium]